MYVGGGKLRLEAKLPEQRSLQPCTFGAVQAAIKDNDVCKEERAALTSPVAPVPAKKGSENDSEVKTQ